MLKNNMDFIDTVNAFHTFQTPVLLHLPFISIFCSLYMLSMYTTSRKMKLKLILDLWAILYFNHYKFRFLITMRVFWWCRGETTVALGDASKSCILYCTGSGSLQCGKQKDISWFECLQNSFWWGIQALIRIILIHFLVLLIWKELDSIDSCTSRWQEVIICLF